MSETSRRLPFPLACVLGAVVFVGLRVPLLLEAYVSDAVGDVGGTAPWLVRSIPVVALAYVAAAVPAVALSRDGARAWWLPSVAFLALGTPIERWLGYDSIAVREAGAFVAMAIDIVVVLGPAFVARRGARVARRPIGRDRFLAAAVVLAAYLAWLLPRSLESSDPLVGSVALVFVFAVCWRAEGPWRKAAFVAVAFAASKLAAYLVFEGPDALGAGIGVSLDLVVVTVGGLLITPVTAAIERGAARARLARA
jgi:hypothetical protein